MVRAVELRGRACILIAARVLHVCLSAVRGRYFHQGAGGWPLRGRIVAVRRNFLVLICPDPRSAE